LSKVQKSPKIEFLNLKALNFGPYKDEHEIIFSVDPINNITLIIGEQGSGKSNLFQIIWWLLFPEFAEEKKLNELKMLHSKKLIDAVNQVKIRETEKNNLIKMGGSIKFIKYDGSGNSVEYEIHRYYHFIKTGKKTVKFRNDSINKSEEFLVYKNNIIEENQHRVYNLIINDLFPKYVRDFVFIFGEGLERMLSVENVSKIKDDALNISDKPRLSALTKHFDDALKNFRGKRKTADKKNEKLNEINERIDLLQNRFDETKGELKTKQENLLDIELQVERDENEFKKIGENIEYVEKLIEINERIIELNKEKTSIVEKRERILLKYLPFVYMQDAILKIQNDIKKKREKKIYPVPLTTDVLLHIKNQDKCICGTKWTEEMIQFIKEIESNLQTNNFSESMIKFEQKLKDVSKQIIDYKKEIVYLENNLTNKNGQIEKLDTQKRVFENKLSTEEKQEEWYERTKCLEKAVKDGIREHGKTKQLITNLKLKLAEYERDLLKEEESYKKLKTEYDKTKGKHDYTDYIERINKIKEISSEMEKSISEKIRNETEIEILKALKLIAKDPDNWKMVHIKDSDNGNQEFKEDGWVVYAETKTDSEIKNMSTGQTNIIGISFIYALSSILNINLPLMIDSPFVNIDDETREAIIENLPSLYKGRQLVFFMKQQELSGSRNKKDNTIIDLYPKIRKKVGIEYNISNDNNDEAILTRVDIIGDKRN